MGKIRLEIFFGKIKLVIFLGGKLNTEKLNRGYFLGKINWEKWIEKHELGKLSYNLYITIYIVCVKLLF